MTRKSTLLWFVLLFNLSSCISYEKISIEVFKPAQLSLPSGIKKIALVSRNLKYTTDTLQNYRVINKRLVKDKVRFNVDSLAKKTCLDSLAGKLTDQNRFDSIIVLPVSLWPEIRVKEIRPAVNSWYKTVSEKTGADALILLDMFSCFYSIDDHFENPQVNVVTSNIWSVYDARANKIIDRFTQIDTLYWNGFDDANNFRKIKLPNKTDAIRLSAGVIGQNYAKHLIPDWKLVYRDIMTSGNPELQKALKLAQAGNWDEASVIWQRFSEEKNNRNQIIGFYNLALASEMDGNVDKALSFCSLAAKASTGMFNSPANEAVRKYAAILYSRKSEIEKLNNQNELH
jgi:hypothetical protein